MGISSFLEGTYRLLKRIIKGLALALTTDIKVSIERFLFLYLALSLALSAAVIIGFANESKSREILFVNN